MAEGEVPSRQSIIRFGDFELDLFARTLSRRGVLLKLQKQPLEVLVLLIQRSPAVVSRRHIQQHLWGNDVEIDVEQNINFCIRHIRGVLGDTSAAPRFIETSPRIGYRFIAPFEGRSTGTQEPADASMEEIAVAPEMSPEPPKHSNARKKSGFYSNLAPIGIVLLIAAAATFVGYLRWKKQQDQHAELLHGYAIAMQQLRTRDLRNMVAAADEFRHLIEWHPKFALGWAGLAEASALIHPHDASMALELAERSVRMDPKSGECHAILGFILFTRSWQWTAAAEQFDVAASLNPNDSQTWYWIAQSQAARGRPGDAVITIDRARKHSPEAMNLTVMKAACLYFQHDFKGALEVADQALALHLPAAWEWRARALFKLGQQVEGVRSLIYDLGTGSSRSADAVASRADALVASVKAGGLTEGLGKLLEETNSSDVAAIQSHNRAVWFMLLGHNDSALHELEIAVDSHPRPFNLIYLNVDPVFDPIRRRPLFQRIIKKLGIS
ncbi:MAG: hilA 13 [Bryobacterales bacterium]|nr:hilA 13 [Bryobacterales bacterium]